MDKIPFVDGTKISNAKVTIDEQEYEVTPAQYTGTTPMSAFNLNKMQDNIEKAIPITNTIKVSATEPSPKADVWIQHSVNMLKASVSSFSAYGVTGTNKEDGSILVSGNATSANVYLIGLKKINKEYISSGDYTLSINNEEVMSDVSVRLRKVSTSGSKTEIITQALDTINKEISLNSSNLIGSDTSYIELDLYLKTQKQYNFTIYPQFQRGEATEYIAPIEDDILVNDGGAYNSVLPKNKVVWEGSVYQANAEMQLSKTLSTNKLYVMDMFGISSTYHIYFTFVYTGNNNIQFSYNDGTDFFRYRFNISSDRKKITIHSESVNNKENTRIVKIIEIN